ncbi:hypothetical protein BKA66DRAFT_374202, partial [Pyrenochaeta sp. MPI-SDFR-AT-0127]
AFIWPYQLGEDFTAPIPEKKTVPLIMAAHFALLLPNFEIIWFLQGWSDHALAGIGKFINEDHRAWLEWPL